MKKTLVLGVGNTIRGDDGVGIFAARVLRKKMDHPNIDIKETQEAGINLLDMIEGYERVIIIDSIRTRDGKPGVIYRFTPFGKVPIRRGRDNRGDCGEAKKVGFNPHMSFLTGFTKDRFETAIVPYSWHQVGLATVIQMADNLNMDIPGKIIIYAVEIEKGDFFGDGLTSKVREAIPKAVDLIKKELSLLIVRSQKEV